jgi:tetratricopeptide (TPR) repeat protein
MFKRNCFYFFKQNKHDQAYTYFSEAIELNIEKNFELGIIDNYLGMALVNAAMNQKLEGKINLKLAYDISKKLNAYSKILKIEETN